MKIEVIEIKKVTRETLTAVLIRLTVQSLKKYSRETLNGEF